MASVVVSAGLLLAVTFTPAPVSAQSAETSIPVVIAGNPGAGPGRYVAQEPSSIAVHEARLLVADDLYGVIREVDPISTVHLVRHRIPGRGLAETRFTSDPNRINIVSGPDGRVYVADNSTRLVRRIESDGRITIVAGKVTTAPPDNRVPAPVLEADSVPATSVELYDPRGMAFDASGRLLVVDRLANRVYRIDPDGMISIFAGSGNGGFAGDGGPAPEASLFMPTHVAVDDFGVAWIADGANNRFRVVDSTGTIRTAVHAEAKFQALTPCEPGVASDPDRCLNGAVSVAAAPGRGMLLGVGGNIVLARPDRTLVNVAPLGAAHMAVGPDGRLFVSGGTQRWTDTTPPEDGLFVVERDGGATRIGGMEYVGPDDYYGPPTSAGVGRPARLAQLGGMRSIAVRPDGGLAVALRNEPLLGVDRDGILRELGPVHSEPIVVSEPSGTLLVADWNLIFRIRDGRIETVFGRHQDCRPDWGDGGPATEAEFFAIHDITLGPDGSIYVLEKTGRVRRIDSAGTASTVVGDPGEYCQDGLSKSASGPFWGDSIAVDGSGAVFVNGPICLQKLMADGTAPCLGPTASTPDMRHPSGFRSTDVVVDHLDRVVFTDPHARAIRRLEGETMPVVFQGEEGCGPTSLALPAQLGAAPGGGLYVVDRNCDTIVSLDAPLPTPGVVRYGGDDRVHTAAEVSRAGFADGTAGAVVLARADGFADALAGAPLAVKSNGPLLLTPGDALAPWAEAELRRVLPAGGEVWILGGPAAIGPAVEHRLVVLGYRVRRLGGADRFETAVQVAVVGLGRPSRAFLTTGRNFPDAVSAAAAAGALDAAVLLTDGEKPAAATERYLVGLAGPVTAIGGPASRAHPGYPSIVGRDRYATSLGVAQQLLGHASAAGVATGRKFPDALSGGAAMGAVGGPVVLVDPGASPQSTAAAVLAAVPSATEVSVFGGEAAVPASVEAAFRDSLAP